MIQLNYRDARPLYEQIKEKIRHLIVSGVLTSDTPLPSVRDLAQSLTVNPNTIQKAYRELESAGYIYSVKGRGSFVAQQDKNDSVYQQRIETLLVTLGSTITELVFLGFPDHLIRLRADEVIINTHKQQEVQPI